MSLELWAAFVIAASIMLVIPGPTTLAIVSYALSSGRRANAPLVVAVALGDSTALALSLLGVGALLAASAFWFTVIKWLGGLYLLYLGIQMLRSGASGAAPPVGRPSGKPLRLFLNTYVITALNPKGVVFFVAFLPQFIDPSRAAMGPANP